MNVTNDCKPFAQSNQSLPYQMELSGLYDRTRKGLLVFLVVVAIIASIVTFLGNLVVMITVLVYRQLRIPANFLLVNLSVANLLVGVVLQPFYIFFNLTQFHQSGTLANCKQAFFFDIVSGLTISGNLNSLLMIAFDRYIAIIHPLRYASIIINTRVRAAILCSWLVSASLEAVLNIPDINFTMKVTVRHIYQLLFCLTMMFVYLRIFRASQKQSNKIRQEQRVDDPGFDCRYEKRGLKTVAMIMAFMLLCFIPKLFLQLEITVNGFNIGKTHKVVRAIALHFAISFIMLHSALNPLLYFYRSRELCGHSRKLLASMFHKLRGSDENLNTDPI